MNNRIKLTSLSMIISASTGTIANDNLDIALNKTDEFSANSELSFNRAIHFAGTKKIELSAARNGSSGYKQMFELKKSVIELSVVGFNETIKVDGLISYYKVVVDENEKIATLLREIGMSKTSIDKLTLMLQQGVNSSPKCQGNKSECIISSGELDFVVDFYNNTLRIFIPSNMLKKKDTSILLANTSNTGLVSNLYSNASYENNEGQFYVRSENTLGLGKGHVDADFSLNESTNNIDKLHYNYDGENYSSSFGLINSTLNLGVASHDSLFTGKYVGIAASNQKNRLLKNTANRHVEFFSPSEGNVEITKDDEVVYRGYALSGRNFIEYSNLPSGNYEVEIEVEKDGTTVYESKELINNTSGYDLKSTSYYARMGSIERSSDSIEDGSAFIDTGISFPFTENSSIVANFSLMKNDPIVGVGYFKDLEFGNFSFKTHVGDSGLRSVFTLYTPYFNANYTKVSIFNEESSWLGDSDSSDGFIGTSYRWENFSFTANLNYRDSEYFGSDTDATLGINYFSRKGWSVYLNATFDRDLDHSMNLGLNIPLHDNTTFTSGTILTNENELHYSNAINTNYRIDDKNHINGSIGYNKSDSDEYTTARIGYNQYKDEYSMSSNLVHGKDGFGVNGSFSTTTFITKNQIDFGNTFNDQNGIIDVYGKDGKPIKGNIELYDHVSGYTKTYKIDESEVIPSSEYTRKTIRYDFDDYNYVLEDINIKNSSEFDITPAKVKYVEVNQSPIGNILVINANLNKQPVCNGDGCLDSVPVNNRVTRFMVKPDTEVNIELEGVSCFNGIVKHGLVETRVCE